MQEFHFKVDTWFQDILEYNAEKMADQKVKHLVSDQDFILTSIVNLDTPSIHNQNFVFSYEDVETGNIKYITIPLSEVIKECSGLS